MAETKSHPSVTEAVASVVPPVEVDPAGGSATLLPSLSKTADTQLSTIDTANDEKRVSKESSTIKVDEEEKEEDGYLSGFKLIAVFLACMATVFMFALDQSIVATAIPHIVSQFNSFSQVAWLVTAYFLTQVGLILLAGQLLTLSIPKHVLLVSIFLFELGSLIAGVAPNMDTLIFGRALQGVGAAGLFVSILTIISLVTRLKDRPLFFSSFGLVFVVSSVAGPLLGGALTQHATWRWAFYINLPLGGLAAAAVVFILPAKAPKRADDFIGGWKGFVRLDWLGSLLVMSGITCLLLALQWGGTQYAWTNWRIGFLFGLGGLLLVIFGIWEWRLDKRALLPLALLKNRSQVCACMTVFFLFSAMLGGTYQLPLFYQATRAQTPTRAGISVLVFMLSVTAGIGIAGGVTNKTGRYYAFLVLGPPITLIGNVLLFSQVHVSTSDSKLFGFQFLAGFGIGLCMQIPLLAIQAEYADRPNLLPQASGLISFAQLAGAAIGLGVVNTVQSVYLKKELDRLVAAQYVEQLRASVAAIYQLPEAEQPAAIEAYTRAITQSFLPLVICCAVAWVFAIGIRNRSMKGVKTEMTAA